MKLIILNFFETISFNVMDSYLKCGGEHFCSWSSLSQGHIDFTIFNRKHFWELCGTNNLWKFNGIKICWPWWIVIITPKIKNQIKNLLTSSSELITLGSLLSNEYTPKNFWHSLLFPAKYCQGCHVVPLSTDRSNTQTPGRGEFAMVTTTYATWNSFKENDSLEF